MCGRYQIEDDSDEAKIKSIIDEFNRREREENDVELKPGTVYPTDAAPVILRWQE